MVLHELAHAYRHQVLGFDHAGIRRRRDEAMRNKLYDSVLHINGSKRRHYACTNAIEYFAEMTEAYFGTNDGPIPVAYASGSLPSSERAFLLGCMVPF